PIASATSFAEVTPLRPAFAQTRVGDTAARTLDRTSSPIPIPLQSDSRALTIVGVVAVGLASLATGFGGGFIVGQRSRLSIESIEVSHHESVAAPQPARAAVVDSKPIAPTAQAAAVIPEEKVSSPEPIPAPAAAQPAAPDVESGRLLVRSTPSGADVVVDGQPRGITPLTLRELSLGAHAIEVSQAGHEARRQRVTLSERRPERSIDFELRP